MTEKQEITPCPKCGEATTYTLIIKKYAWYLNCGACGEFITLWRDDCGLQIRTPSQEPAKSSGGETPRCDAEMDEASNIALYATCANPKTGLYRGKKIETTVVPFSFAQKLERELNEAIANLQAVERESGLDEGEV